MSSCNPIPTNKWPAAYAQSLVKDAIPFYNENGRAAAVECFSSLDQVDGQGYVIILDENNVFLETSFVQLIGRDLSRLEVVNGIRSSEHIASIRTTNKWFSNVFPNPETNEQHKETRLVRPPRRAGSRLRFLWVREALQTVFFVKIRVPSWINPSDRENGTSWIHQKSRLAGKAHPNGPKRACRFRPFHLIFPKILQEPRKCATLFPTTFIHVRGPGATRHFATHENRLPILPMSPNHAERTAALPAQPCRIRPLSAFHKEPLFAYVSDRLRSSGIVPDRTSAPPLTARHSRRMAAMFTRFRPPNRQKSASFRAKVRPQTPVRKEAFPRHFGVIDVSNCWSTRVGIYSMPAFSSDFGPPASWRADRRTSRSRQLCPSQESDEL